MDKIFVMASDDLRDECVSEASNWINDPSQQQFSSTKNSTSERLIVAVVSEYLANKKGFTLYPRNATYPKDKS